MCFYKCLNSDNLLSLSRILTRWYSTIILIQNRQQVSVGPNGKIFAISTLKYFLPNQLLEFFHFFSRSISYMIKSYNLTFFQYEKWISFYIELPQHPRAYWNFCQYGPPLFHFLFQINNRSSLNIFQITDHKSEPYYWRESSPIFYWPIWCPQVWYQNLWKEAIYQNLRVQSK